MSKAKAKALTKAEKLNAALIEAAPDLLVWTEGLYSILKLSNVALNEDLKTCVEALIRRAKGEVSRE